MSFAAKYNGKCGECEGVISPGDEVVFDSDHNLCHVDCPEVLPDAPKGKPCPACFTYHAGDCL